MLLLLALLAFLPSPLRSQPYGAMNNLPPYSSPYSSISPYGMGRYSSMMMNPYISMMGGQPFYGKSSYNYLTPYGYGGMSGYEGPPYGINTYWQPGVAYPPMLYGGGQGYGTGYGNCRDRSADCALLASSGQCASSTSTRALCPLSCGLGCGIGDLYGAGAGGLVDPFYRGIDGQTGGGGGQIGQPSGFVGGFPTQSTPLSSQSAPLNGHQFFGGPQFGAASQFDAFGPNGFADQGGLINGGGGPPFFCRDSHIYGCPNWAQQGFCQSVPEFMLNYCRASCGVCNGGMNGGGPLGSAIGGIVGNGLGLGLAGLGGASGNAGAFSGPFHDDPLSMQFSTDSHFAAADPLSTSTQLFGPGTSSMMFPYSPYYPFRASAASTTERKEKQQRNEGNGAKLLFNEDDVAGLGIGSIAADQQQLFAAGLAAGNNNLLGGLPSASQSASFSPSSSSQSQSSLLNPSQTLPPSSLSTQHSSVSKLVRMDDLLLADAKNKQRKSRR